MASKIHDQQQEHEESEENGSILNENGQEEHEMNLENHENTSKTLNFAENDAEASSSSVLVTNSSSGEAEWQTASEDQQFSSTSVVKTNTTSNSPIANGAEMENEGLFFFSVLWGVLHILVPIVFVCNLIQFELIILKKLQSLK